MATLTYRVAENGHFKLKNGILTSVQCCAMNQSFLGAFYHTFLSKLSTNANNVQFHVPCKSGKIVSVSTIILHLHWIQELFCRVIFAGKYLQMWNTILLAHRDLGTPMLGTVCPREEEFFILLICLKRQNKGIISINIMDQNWKKKRLRMRISN